MNDLQIREQFHQKRLRRYHADANTVVVDELGLKHGACRADIAVINNHLTGYEIKSDEDSFRRLPEQIRIYSAVFDYASVIVSTRRVYTLKSLIPRWWGLIVAREGSRGRIIFEVARKCRLNESVDPFSVAQLLWRNEAAIILENIGVNKKVLRSPRKLLYEYLAAYLSLSDLREAVRSCLKSRTMWRRPEPPSQGDDSCQPSTM
jgi:hypothetical protein